MYMLQIEKQLQERRNVRGVSEMEIHEFYSVLENLEYQYFNINVNKYSYR